MKYSWEAIKRPDGRLGLTRTRKISRYLIDNRIRIRFKRGTSRLITSFSRLKLMKIAWKCDVTNPEGFDRDDAKFLGVTNEIGFNFYQTGWSITTKEVIGRYIWNRLYDLHITQDL